MPYGLFYGHHYYTVFLQHQASRKTSLVIYGWKGYDIGIRKITKMRQRGSVLWLF